MDREYFVDPRTGVAEDAMLRSVRRYEDLQARVKDDLPAGCILRRANPDDVYADEGARWVVDGVPSAACGRDAGQPDDERMYVGFYTLCEVEAFMRGYWIALSRLRLDGESQLGPVRNLLSRLSG